MVCASLKLPSLEHKRRMAPNAHLIEIALPRTQEVHGP